MDMLALRRWCSITLLSVLVGLAAHPSFAQAPASPEQARPAYPPPTITLGEARAVIEGAIAYTREQNMRMAIVVVDTAGNVVSSDRMDGASLQNIRFAEGKAYASALYRQTTEELGELYKTRPDRYFGIISMFPGKVYLVGGGVPLAVDGRLVGGVGVAGLPQGVDEKAARAGIAAWMKYRETMKK
jgi:uncharacterized protein GlcG (DUF336 family)